MALDDVADDDDLWWDEAVGRAEDKPEGKTLMEVFHPETVQPQPQQEQQQNFSIPLSQEPEHLSLRVDNIEHEYAVIGPRIAYQGRVCAQAQAQAEIAKEARDRTYAMLWLQAKSLIEEGRARVGSVVVKPSSRGATEAQIDAVMRAMEPMASQRSHAAMVCIQATAAAASARSDFQALITEANMLTMVSSDRRKEMGTIEPTMRNPRDAADAADRLDKKTNFPRKG
jgi:hypothetical protein